MLGILRILPPSALPPGGRLRQFLRGWPPQTAQRISDWGRWMEVTAWQGRTRPAALTALSRRERLRWMPSPALPAALPTADTTRLRESLTAATAVQILAALRIPPFRSGVTLVDLEGRYTGWVERFIPYCQSVRVISRVPARYRAVQQQMMARYGAVVFVGEDLAGCGEPPLVVDPEAALPAGATAAPVLTAASARPAAGLLAVWGLGLSPPQALCRQLPPEVPAAGFFLALLAESRSWDAAWPADFGFCGQNPVTPGQVAEYIEAQLLGRPPAHRPIRSAGSGWEGST